MIKLPTDTVGYCSDILRICLIPQIYVIIKTKHIDNISYIFIPTIIELRLILFLLILKIIYNKKDIQIQVDKI